MKKSLELLKIKQIIDVDDTMLERLHKIKNESQRTNYYSESPTTFKQQGASVFSMQYFYLLNDGACFIIYEVINIVIFAVASSVIDMTSK